MHPLLILICFSVAFSSPVDKRSRGTTSSEVCKGLPDGNLVADERNCSRFYTCVYGMPILRSCAPGTWFDVKIRNCNSIGSFDATEKAKCYGTGAKKLIKKTVKRCYLSKGEAKVEWIHKDTKNSISNGTLPNKIVLDLPFGNESAKLEFVKRQNFTQNIKVITSFKGRPEIWEPEESEEWSVYSDPTSNASMSVVTRIVNGSTTVYYDGSFIVNNTRYQIRADRGHRPYPVDQRNARLVTMNDTDYLVSQDRNDSNIIDIQGRQSASAASTMSNLERIISNMEQNKEMAITGKKSYGIELFIVLDYSIYFKWLMQSRATDAKSKAADAISNIKYFYTHIVNGINDRYMSIEDNDASFYVRVIAYSIAQTPDDSPFTELQGVKINGQYATNAHLALNEFERWIEGEAKKPNSRFPSFDSAALFTDYEMKMQDTNGYYTITGLANIGKTCTLKGVSINKDYGQYATIETSAHEIGHNMGALHDGDNNECKVSDQFIMASAPGQLTDAIFYNPYKFSPCSIRYFKAYIQKLDDTSSNCLLNSAVNKDPLFDSNLNTLPGQKYDIDLQCRLLFGNSSFYCAGGGERDSMVCKELSCFNPKINDCFRKVEQRALDGTSCGNGAWCLRSACVADAKAKTGPDTCIYGDFKANFMLENNFINCEWMARNRPFRCYEKYYNDLCCASCAARANNKFPTCEFGDKLDMCSTISPSLCYDNYYREHCCAKCKEFELNLPLPNCRYGNKVSWCNGIQPTTCYGSGELCCQTCSAYKKNVTGCEYGDRNPSCNRDYCSMQMYWSDCCKTCESYINGLLSSTTTTTTTTTSTTTTTTTKTTTSTTTDRPLPGIATCPGGDRAFWCATISSFDCYGANITCCSACKQHYKPENVGCEYGDKAGWCSSYVHSSNECRNEKVAEQCCQTCKQYMTSNLVLPSCPKGDRADYCRQMKSWECYNLKETCCATCSQYYNSNLTNCEYGDKVDWCKSYVQGPEECKRPEVAEYCCDTCAKLKTRNTLTFTNPCQDRADWCSTMHPGFCYDPKVESTCCATCSSRKKSNENCKYGDHYNWCAKEYCSMNAVECCETCI